MSRVSRVRFSIRAMMVVAAVAGVTSGLYFRAPRQPDVPGLDVFDVGRDRLDPFPGRSYDEIVRMINEAPSCRFPMFQAAPLGRAASSK
jgi:hypothetical protein